MPLARTTPSASVERNRAGTVRRFLASSVWSKVPRKAKAHAGWPAGGDESGGGVGGAPPPDSDRDVNPLSPTLQHDVFQTPHSAISRPHRGPVRRRVQDRVQRGDLQRAV